MAFTSAKWLDSPSPLTALVTSHVGVHTGAFHFQWFPITGQDLLAKRAQCLSPSDNPLHGGTSLTWVIFFNDAPKSLPSVQSMTTARTPGWLGFPIWAPCVINVTLILHVALVTWCVKGTLPLNIQCSISVKIPRRAMLAQLLKQLGLPSMLLV